MKTVAFVPMKLNNERLPGKNTKLLGGKPLCGYILETLLTVDGIDEIYVYCSDESITGYLPSGVKFLKRPTYLDGFDVKFQAIGEAFIKEVLADVYVLINCVVPFTKRESIHNALDQVLSGKYDSAFSARAERTFAWYCGEVLNYNPSDIPRTQDMEPIVTETCSFYIFRRDVLGIYGRRIGYKPYIQLVSDFESIDIDYPDDFALAEAVFNAKLVTFTPPPIVTKL
jgi:CMP-N-acetylneuraminic acid synthetase